MSKIISKLCIFAILGTIFAINSLQSMHYLGPIQSNSNEKDHEILIVNYSEKPILVRVTYGYLSKVMYLDMRHGMSYVPNNFNALMELDGEFIKLDTFKTKTIRPKNKKSHGILWEPQNISCITKITIRPDAEGIINILKSYFESKNLENIECLKTNVFEIWTDRNTKLIFKYKQNFYIDLSGT
ncbi:hypothetical protein M1446_02625 [Candidatus Dependentiae bacterium]|nr:hypothetical protein [Candidatus Dependentiae bacterium]